jgi:hypothetical protein
MLSENPNVRLVPRRGRLYDLFVDAPTRPEEVEKLAMEPKPLRERNIALAKMLKRAEDDTKRKSSLGFDEGRRTEPTEMLLNQLKEVVRQQENARMITERKKAPSMVAVDGVPMFIPKPRSGFDTDHATLGTWLEGMGGMTNQSFGWRGPGGGMGGMYGYPVRGSLSGEFGSQSGAPSRQWTGKSAPPAPPVLSKIPYLDRLFRNEPRGDDDLLTYSRPHFTADSGLFTDLLAYAPGMNTSAADVQAVLEAEAAPQLLELPGYIDPEARKLIETARGDRWQEVELFDEQGKSALTIWCNASGSFNYERTVLLGLREEVSCDGTTLVHLYPELGVGAKRAVSRFHRAEFAQLVPWILLPADDLARGADVRLVDEHTVAITPVVDAQTPGANAPGSPRVELRRVAPCFSAMRTSANQVSITRSSHKTNPGNDLWRRHGLPLHLVRPLPHTPPG